MSLKKRETIIVCFVYALTVAMYVLAAGRSAFPLSWGDACNYLSLPANIVYHDRLSFNNIYMAVPPPVYSLFLLPAYWVANDIDSLLSATVFLNGAAYGLLVFIVSSLFKRFGLPLAFAVCCILLIVLSPGAFQYTQDIMAEAIYVPLFCFAFLLATGLLSNISVAGLLVVLSLMTMAKPIAVVPAIVIGLFVVYRKLNDPKLNVSWLAVLLNAVFPTAILMVWLRHADSFGDFPAAYPGSFKAALLYSVSTVEGFSIMVERLTNLVGYTLISTWFLPLLFLLPDPSKSSIKHSHRQYLVLALLLWVMMSGLCVITQATYFKTKDGHYFLYGRYVEAVLPIFLSLSFVQLIQLAIAYKKIELSKTAVAGRVAVLAIAVSILAFFPYQHWQGIHSIGLSPAVYTMYLPERFLLPVVIFGLAFGAILFVRNRWRLTFGLVYLLTLTLTIFVSNLEIERVEKPKGTWRRVITDRDFYAAAPPEQVTHIIVERDAELPSGIRKAIWYLKAVYFKSRYLFDDQLEGSAPKGTIFFTTGDPPEQFKPCGSLFDVMDAYCKL